MSSPSNAPKGPSKNEQKKLAKKAAKAALKADSSSNSNNKSSSSNSKKSETTPTTTTSPSFVLYNAKADCDASLKAIWSCLTFDCLQKLQTGVASVSSSGSTSSSTGSSSFTVAHGPFLTLGRHDAATDSTPVVMGGNGMAKAFCGTSSNDNVTFMVDEWCEWERCVLRNNNNNNSHGKQALAHLEKELSSKHFLVGHALSVADICVLVTLYSLYQNNEENQLPLAVQEYTKVHASSYESAKQHLQQLLERRSALKTEIDLTNPSLTQVVAQVFGNALHQLFGHVINLQDIATRNLASKTQNPKHGDFQCSAAMPIFAALKKANSLQENNNNIATPQDVGHALIRALDESQQTVLEHLSVEGPGFVSCRISSSFLESHVNALVTRGALPKPTRATVEPTVCLVDFSSPNIAKEMHVGHLRSTIIGEAVCRILEFVGHDVKRINHVGDWGTQFGMLIQYLKEEYPNFNESKPNITDLTVFYKNAKERFDADADFKKLSQTNVVKLQSGNAECLELWQLLCNVSRSEFQKVYNRLDITVEECGESFYNDKIPAVIAEFEQAGLVSIEEGGAKCVFCDGFKVPLMLQKSDGGYGYDSTDMAALSHRLRTVQAKRIIVITDFSQGDHFKMCFAAANKIGWLSDDDTVKLQHIGFGTVQGQDGKRFKTRSGDTVRLVDLLDEAVHRMEESLRERIDEGRANITLDELHSVAEAIGYGAVKYFDLRRNPTTNYKFSYDQMLDTKGNTAVYLMYAHARLQSIMTKAEAQHSVKVEDILKTDKILLGHPSERNLAMHLQLFTDTMIVTLEDLYPYHICEYLYNTAIAASEFVTQCKVLGSPEMNSRLLLCHATALAMRECFQLLGIRPVMSI